MTKSQDEKSGARQRVHGQSAKCGYIRTNQERSLEISPHDSVSLAQRQVFSVCGPMVLAGASVVVDLDAEGSSAMPSLAAKSASA